MVLSDCYSWADDIFGSAELGDLRRTRRLVTLASSLAQHTELSIVKSSRSPAEVEGAYRLMRNPAVLPDAIADAGFAATARVAAEHTLLLALEDTTTLNFGHSSATGELGNIGTSQYARGLMVYSVLLYAPDCARGGDGCRAGFTPEYYFQLKKNRPEGREKLAMGCLQGAPKSRDVRHLIPVPGAGISSTQAGEYFPF